MKAKHLHLTISVLVLLFIISFFIGVQMANAEKIKIEKLDDLPRHTYTTEMKAVDLIDDEAALKALAAEVKADLLSDLATYDIQDKTTLKDYYTSLGTIALVEKNYLDYLHYLTLRKELEEKESSRYMSGLYTRAYIRAELSGKNLQDTFREEYTRMVEALPFEIVQDDVESTKGYTDIISKNLSLGMIQERVQPTIDQNNGTMSRDIAERMINTYSTINFFVPLKEIMNEVLTAYLDAHVVVKPDIWQEREVDLSGDMKGKPVVIAVWDSGVDTDVYKGHLYTNPQEKPNKKDDDKNGFVDDLHGIAYDLHANKVDEMLYPIGSVSDRPRLQMLMKGLTDLTSNIDSKEATEIKKILGSLQPEEVKPFIEDVNKYGNYAHGTHVAGIALRGNPFARLLGARLTFGHTLIPEKPSIEQAKKDAVMYMEVINYFKDHNVRVVNMSWGGDLGGIESALEENGVGETAEERKALARQIFDIEIEGLRNALASAPEILFITSAGNTNSDVEFDDIYPSSLNLPNMITVGAVDQAGEETDFTSFGRVDCYANGFEVLSYVPGGDRMELSGTSQASPNVTNLAGKLLALNPDLTPAQVRELIQKGCEERMAGERSVRLINPRESMMLLQQMK